MSDIMNKYSIGASEFGTFAGSYYIGYIIAHIPIGILISSYGARIILPLCIICSAIGLVPIIYSEVWYIVILGRLVTGIGSSAAIVAALHILRILYPRKFARMLGVMVALSLFSTVYSSKLLSELITSIGVKSSLILLLYIGIILSCITYLVIPDNKDRLDNSKNIP